MRQQEFRFINSLVKDSISSIDDVLNDHRLRKYFWVEIILNPLLVEELRLHLDDIYIKKCLTDAFSWYSAFHWILPKNRQLDDLYESHLIKPYKITMDNYRRMRSAFLKGLIYAGLC